MTADGNDANAPPPPPSSSSDYRAIGAAQELFTTSVYSPGSPLFQPNGTHILNKLIDFLRAQYKLFGFQEVLTPTIYKKSLWEVSGHWQNYKDDMYEVSGRGASGSSSSPSSSPSSSAEQERVPEGTTGEDESYGLKPMNCPGHCLLFKGQKWSYRQLPVRYADFSPLHRNEVSGALSGLTRVRRFHQDDGHVFCRPQQIGREIALALDFTDTVLRTFGLQAYRLVLSTRPEKEFIGSVEMWDDAETQLRAALQERGRPWELSEGDGAFYGPKIDLQIPDSHGKYHQLSTIQLDLNLPQRFGLEYEVAEGEPDHDATTTTTNTNTNTNTGRSTPVLIHRAIFGSLERFLALLIERYQGRWPFWLSPRQGIILTVNQSEDLVRAANHAAAEMSGLRSLPDEDDTTGTIHPLSSVDPTFNIDVDASARSVSKKIREAQINKYNLIFVLGPKNLADGSVDVDFSGQVAGRDMPAMNKIVADAPCWDADVSVGKTFNKASMKMKVAQVYPWLVQLERGFN